MSRDLPDMLRAENPMCERRSATPEEWQANGKWTLYPIGPELAALVEADDRTIKAADDLCTRGLWPDTLLRYEVAKQASAVARAALKVVVTLPDYMVAPAFPSVRKPAETVLTTLGETVEIFRPAVNPNNTPPVKRGPGRTRKVQS